MVGLKHCLGGTIMKIISIIGSILLLLANISYADEIDDKRAPQVSDLKNAVNLKDLTCVFSQKRWNYSEGEKVNGKDLLAYSMHQISGINPTVECMHDDTCYFTCYDQNNQPYSGDAYDTDDAGNVVLIRPLKDGLPTDGIIKSYDSSCTLDLEICVEQNEIIRYDINYDGNIVKHIRDTDNPNIWYFRRFYPNDQVESEVIFDKKENKIIHWNMYNEDGSIKTDGDI